MAVIKRTRHSGSGKVDIRMELPDAVVERINQHGLKIEFRPQDRKLMLDQGAGMGEGDGCISNPGGPSC